MRLFRTAVVLLVASSCATTETPLRPPPVEYHPPPLPGFSLESSVMCSCTACATVRCCRGEGAEDEAACVATDGGVACAMDLGSCAPRCARVTWRVPKDDACDLRRPAACCEGT